MSSSVVYSIINDGYDPQTLRQHRIKNRQGSVVEVTAWTHENFYYAKKKVNRNKIQKHLCLVWA